jgi:lipoprotein-releasing system permease protein
VAGKYIEGASPTVNVPAMLTYRVNGGYINRQITLIGIDEASYASVSDFGHYLQHPENRNQLDFKLKGGGYDTVNYESARAGKGIERPQMRIAGWKWRREAAKSIQRAVAPVGSLDGNPFAAAPEQFAGRAGEDFDPAREQHAGCVLGIGICSYRQADAADIFLALPATTST